MAEFAAKGGGTAVATDSSTDSKSQELMDMIEETVKRDRIAPHLLVTAPDVVPMSRYQNFGAREYLLKCGVSDPIKYPRALGPARGRKSVAVACP